MSDQEIFERMQADGLRKCREMLYKRLSDNEIPMECLSAIEEIVEEAYRIGINTEADIIIAIS